MPRTAGVRRPRTESDRRRVRLERRCRTEPSDAAHGRRGVPGSDRRRVRLSGGTGQSYPIPRTAGVRRPRAELDRRRVRLERRCRMEPSDAGYGRSVAPLGGVGPICVRLERRCRTEPSDAAYGWSARRPWAKLDRCRVRLERGAPGWSWVDAVYGWSGGAGQSHPMPRAAGARRPWFRPTPRTAERRHRTEPIRSRARPERGVPGRSWTGAAYSWSGAADGVETDAAHSWSRGAGQSPSAAAHGPAQPEVLLSGPAERHQQGLLLAEGVETLGAVLAAEPGVLVAAER